MTLSIFGRRFFNRNMSDRAHIAMSESNDVVEQAVTTQEVAIVEPVEQVEQTMEPMVTRPVEDMSAQETNHTKLEQKRSEVQENIDRISLMSLELINNPSSAIDKVIRFSSITIENYQESQKLCTAEHIAKKEAIEDNRVSKTTLDEIEVNNRLAIIRDNESEIARLKMEVAQIEQAAIARNESFDVLVVNINETYTNNMNSYEQLIAAEKSKIAKLSSTTKEIEEFPTTHQKSKKSTKIKQSVQGIDVDDIAQEEIVD